MTKERNAQTNGSGLDMRILMIGILASYALLLLATGIFGLPERAVLQGLGVPALDHPFMDLRGVAAWCEAFRHGKDPSISPTWIVIPEYHDQPNFLMNYSPLVLGFGWLGLLPGTIITWGIVSGMIFFAAVWVLAGRCTVGRAFLWALLICSPDAVLVVERGNLDIFLFVFLVAALELREHPPFDSGLILVGALVKFFPIVALLAPWSKAGRHLKISAGIAAMLFLLSLFMLRSRIVSIGGSLSGQCHSAFGCAVPADLLIRVGFPVTVAGESLQLLLKTVAIVLLLLSFGTGLLLNSRRWKSSVTGRSLYAFFLGAPVMGLLFIIGNQMDYKWIFLLFMIPAVLEMIDGESKPVVRIAIVWLCGMTTYSWWTFFSDEGSLRNALLKQAAMWVVMISGALLAGILWRERRSS